MLDSLTKLLLATGFGVSIFVIFQLIREGKASQLPIKLGIIMLVVWVFRFLLFFIKFEEWALSFPLLLIIDQYLFLLDGPLLWIYTRSVLTSNKFTPKIVWHFTLFLIGTLLAITNAVLYPEEVIDSFKSSVNALLQNEPILDPGVIIYIVILIGLTVFYYLKSRSELRRYNATLMDNFSNIENLKVNWVLSFQKMWIILFGVPLVVYFFNYLFPTINVLVTGGIFLVGLVSLSLFFSSRLLIQSYSILPIASKEPVKPEVSDQLTANDQQLLEALYQKLTDEKYYEDEKLSLDQLAGYLEMKSKELTDLIKKSPYNNFYDLVNTFRIEAVQRTLADSKEQIIVIAYQCGFNSKSAFNKIFKEKTGFTPKEYRLSLK